MSQVAGCHLPLLVLDNAGRISSPAPHPGLRSFPTLSIVFCMGYVRHLKCLASNVNTIHGSFEPLSGWFLLIIELTVPYEPRPMLGETGQQEVIAEDSFIPARPGTGGGSVPR